MLLVVLSTDLSIRCTATVWGRSYLFQLWPDQTIMFSLSLPSSCVYMPDIAGNGLWRFISIVAVLQQDKLSEHVAMIWRKDGSRSMAHGSNGPPKLIDHVGRGFMALDPWSIKSSPACKANTACSYRLRRQNAKGMSVFQCSPLTQRNKNVPK